MEWQEIEPRIGLWKKKKESILHAVLSFWPSTLEFLPQRSTYYVLLYQVDYWFFFQ